MFKYDGSRMPFDSFARVLNVGQWCAWLKRPMNSFPVYDAVPKFTQNGNTVTSDLLSMSFFNLENIRGYYKIESDGYRIRLLNSEDVAIGAGLTMIRNERSVTKSGDNYEAVRWDRFNQYAEESMQYINLEREKKYFNIPFERDSYMPLKLAIMVIGRCHSEKARVFQGFVAETVSDFIDQLLDEKYDKMIDEMTEVIEYQNEYLNTEGLFTSRQIAADFNLTAQQLHKFLHVQGFIYRCNGQWIVRSSYTKTLAVTKSIDIDTPAGKRTVTYWTEAGRYFLYSILLSYDFKQNQNNQELLEFHTKK